MPDPRTVTSAVPRKEILFHFDVDGHALSLDTFINTATNTRAIIEAYNRDLFDGQLAYELVVLAPEPGSFLSKLALFVWGGAASVFAFLETDMGAAYFEGLTGKEPKEYAQELGERHKEALNPGIGDEILEEDKNELGTCLIIEMTEGLLEVDRDTVLRIVPKGLLDDAISARGAFFEACLENNAIQGLGFVPENEFPIPRNKFAERAQRIRRDDELLEGENEEWYVTCENIFVSSPNWDKDDQEHRNWKGKDAARKDCYFVIDDEEFWQHVKDRELDVGVLDGLMVQWAFQLSGNRPKNRRVLRVLEFNGERLSNPLNESVIQSILGRFSSFEMSADQNTLFDDTK